MIQPKSVLIIDDERLARVELKALLSSIPSLKVVAEASNAEEGLLYIRSLQPELIFLDIQMPEKSGFDLLEELDEIPAVIFTTAYDEYALKAFDFHALDYLLKPIQQDRLLQAVTKALNRDRSSSAPPSQPAFEQQLYLKEGDRHHFVELADISMFSSYGNYVKIFVDQRMILVHRSLNQLEHRLPSPPFFRANRFSLINVGHIHSLKQGPRSKLIASLSSGHEVELSERKSTQFREIWGI
ncbi:MAG: LytTR family DNA-binding domain-containing protein [Bacteroidota bacterium]